MNDEEASTEQSGWFSSRLKTSVLEQIRMNRQIITYHAEKLKRQSGALYAVNHRHLMRLIEAERAYEEELRELFPDL